MAGIRSCAGLALILLMVALMANLAAAQAGNIHVTQETYWCCGIDVPTSGVFSVHVLHVLTAGATASQFAAPKPSCFSATYLSDTHVFAMTVGNSQTGVFVGYGACSGNNIHILTINYLIDSSTPACCIYPVLPDPSVASGQVEVVDCDQNVVIGSGVANILNPIVGCDCLDQTGCFSVPIEKTTWGTVKALYAD